MENFSEKGVINRIIELRTGRFGNRGRSNFAAAIGISPSTYSYYEQDRLPPIPILLRICEVCSCDINWLLTGKSASDDNNNTDCLNGPLAGKIRRVIEANGKNAAAVDAFVGLLSEKTTVEAEIKKKNSPVENKGSGGLIPVLGRTAAGVLGLWKDTDLPNGKYVETQIEGLVQKHLNCPIITSVQGKLSADLQTAKVFKAAANQKVSLVQKASGDNDEIVEFIDCPAVSGEFGDCFALQIDGDSMAPRIDDGDFVILSASATAVQGAAAVVRISDAIGVTCKIIRIDGNNVHLIPINEKYETKVVANSQLVWALAVLCHFRVYTLKGINSRVKIHNCLPNS